MRQCGLENEVLGSREMEESRPLGGFAAFREHAIWAKAHVAMCASSARIDTYLLRLWTLHTQITPSGKQSIHRIPT
jgi:hypothetical protein